MRVSTWIVTQNDKYESDNDSNVTGQPEADLLRNPASFACKLPNSNPVLVFFTVCTAECADLAELLQVDYSIAEWKL